MKKSQHIIEVKNLTFKYTHDDYVVLKNNNLVLEKGARCLLVGTNGAGKSTLLRILGSDSFVACSDIAGGKHMHPRDDVLVLGQSAFYETPRTMAYLGSDWRRSVGAVR